MPEVSRKRNCLRILEMLNLEEALDFFETSVNTTDMASPLR